MYKFDVQMIFRKSQEYGNYSIENSFIRIFDILLNESSFSLSKITLPYVSSGILNRIKSLIFIVSRCKSVNHITGDVHFLAMVLPKNKTIITIHDCVFLEHKNKLARIILKLLWLDWPIKCCRYVTTVSNASKDAILRNTKCDPGKIIVIPTAISGEYRPVSKKFEKDCPNILHIGLAKNKNFERHVLALKGIKCTLRIIGKLSCEHVDFLDQHKINFVSSYNLTSEEMVQAYINADIVLFCSTLEGFGMPIVEAQSVGRAVITSNLSSMPEVSGEGACLVDPYDISSIRNGVLKIINDDSFREKLISQGFKNVKRFNPNNIANQYKLLYKKIANANS
jgi:glycosyltransferase involved in cell wall biosynthesis